MAASHQRHAGMHPRHRNRGDQGSRRSRRGRGDRGPRKPRRSAQANQRRDQRGDRGATIRFARSTTIAGNNATQPSRRTIAIRQQSAAAADRGYGGPRRDYSNFRDFHRSFNASRRFQAPAYRRPAGWYDHRWSFGEFLPAAFWARDYWLIDFADYDLPPPPYGAVWVRVGNDALLIDQDSGEIITVEYGVFY